MVVTELMLVSSFSLGEVSTFEGQLVIFCLGSHRKVFIANDIKEFTISLGI